MTWRSLMKKRDQDCSATLMSWSTSTWPMLSQRGSIPQTTCWAWRIFSMKVDWSKLQGMLSKHLQSSQSHILIDTTQFLSKFNFLLFSSYMMKRFLPNSMHPINLLYYFFTNILLTFSSFSTIHVVSVHTNIYWSNYWRVRIEFPFLCYAFISL